jgi:NADPH:quinone reductase-like Zn-dependent oxidoreductase
MKAIIQSKYGIRNLYLTEVPKPTPGDNEVSVKGEVKPVVDRCYSLHETTDAFRYFNEGHARGKVVVTID